MSASAMDCGGLRESACAYLGGDLAADLRAAAEAHLAACPACRRFLEVARATTCKHVADFLSDYLEDELPETEREAFERHLGGCPPCVDYMRSLEATIAAGRSVCQGDDCPPIPDGLVEAILKSRPRT